MTDNDGAVASPEQDDYAAIVAACRRRLVAVAEKDLASYGPGDVHCYVNAVQALYWLEINAALYDHKIEHGKQCWGD